MDKTNIMKPLLTATSVVAVTGGIVYGTMTFGQNPGAQTNDGKSAGKGGDVSSAGISLASELKDGEYEGSARGYGGEVTVRVRVSGGKIADITVLSQTETPEYFKAALRVLDQIKSKNSIDVDSVSGATVSSDALKLAVARALEKAGAIQSDAAKSLEQEAAAAAAGAQAEQAALEQTRAAAARAQSAVALPANTGLRDGSYTASARGFRGPIQVLVQVSRGQIAGVRVLSHSEDEPYFSRAVSILNNMIGQKSGNVDTVSGATYSSRGLINAVNLALRQAAYQINDGGAGNGSAANASNSDLKPIPNDRPAERPAEPAQPVVPLLPSGSKFKDGTYESTARGFNGRIRLAVEIKNGKLSDIRVLSQSEDAEYYDKAKAVIARMLKSNSGDVDTVSGATITSRGIINAVRQALAMAKVDESVQPGKVDPGKVDPGKEDPSKEEPGKIEPGKMDPGKEEPGKIDPGKKEPEKPLTLVDKTKQLIESMTRQNALKSGVYTGMGLGYNTSRGALKTKVTFEGDQIKDIVVGQGKDYSDDVDGFKDKAIKAIPFFLDANKGRHHLAVLRLHRDYVDQITRAKNPQEKAEELLGKEYAQMLGSRLEIGETSRAIKSFLKEQLGEEAIFDAVSGATMSAGGLARSVDQALELSETDAKTGNSVRALTILSPTDKNFYNLQSELKQNKKKPLDLHNLVVALAMEDGSEKQIAYSDFAANDLEIVTEKGEQIQDGMDISAYVKNGTLITNIIHKSSKRSARLGIVFGSFSSDYLTKLEYSLDGGQSWTLVENPQMSDAAGKQENIAERQTIKLRRSELGKKIRVRMTAKSGEEYLYESSEPLEYKKMTLSALDKSFEDNENANFALFWQINEDKSDMPTPLPGENEEEEGDETIEASFEASYLNHGRIKDVEVKAGKGIVLDDAQDLPDGLVLDGDKITGTIEIPDEEFAESTMKEYTATILGTKNGKDVEATFKITVYQDRDRDGVNDNDEGEKGSNEFTPMYRGKTYAEKLLHMQVGDPLPSLADFKRIFWNIPDDDSVEIEFVKEPDMSRVHKEAMRVRFKSKYVTGVSTTTIGLSVDKRAEEAPQEVGASDLNASFSKENLNHSDLAPVTIEMGDGVSVSSVDGLPSGLRLEDGKILGRLALDGSVFENNYKEFTIQINATKDGKKIYRKMTMAVYEDKDRDGINDNDEGDEGSKEFTPQFKASSYNDRLVHTYVGSDGPSIEDYKKTFKNIPDDGSVTITVVKAPSTATEGKRVARLSFSSKYVSGVSMVSVPVLVEKAPELPPVEAAAGELTASFADVNLNHSKLEDVVITAGEGVGVSSVDGLPNGLELKEGKIVGELALSHDVFENNFKDFAIRIHGVKGNQKIYRDLTMRVFEDKDRDGVNDNDEGDEGSNAFTGLFKTSGIAGMTITKKLGEAAPSMEEYAALFKNIPADGSVSLSLQKEPDMNKKGRQTLRVIFHSSHVDGVSYRAISLNIVP